MILCEFQRATDLEALDGETLERFARVEGDGALTIAEAGPGRPVTQLFNGGTYGGAGGPFLFHVALWTPEDFRDEFLAWYECEHLPLLLEADGWDGCRFVEERVADGCLFHALHQLRDRSALDSDARKRSRATPWFGRLARNSWFDTGFKRTLYRRL